jgi:hypothetical protein
MLWEHVVWRLLDLNHHNLASTKAFDIEIDNLIRLSQKMLSKRGFETNLNEKDQNAMLDILKWNLRRRRSPKSYYCLQ